MSEKVDAIGRLAFNTRVERWETDFNEHWNARFYCRSFQLASERIAFADGRLDGATLPATRRIRFLRELAVGAPVEVRSSFISGGPHHGSVLHLLTSSGAVSATALDVPGRAGDDLPWVDDQLIAHLLVRDLSGPSKCGWHEDSDNDFRTELGVTRPAETDHNGSLLFDEMLGRLGVATSDLFARLGFDSAYIARSGQNRMAAEISVTSIGNCRAGIPLVGRSKVTRVKSKSVRTEHRIETPNGEVLAHMEQTMLIVDLKKRKVIAPPAFLGAACPD